MMYLRKLFERFSFQVLIFQTTIHQDLLKLEILTVTVRYCLVTGQMWNLKTWFVGRFFSIKKTQLIPLFYGCAQSLVNTDTF